MLILFIMNRVYTTEHIQFYIERFEVLSFDSQQSGWLKMSWGLNQVVFLITTIQILIVFP